MERCPPTVNSPTRHQSRPQPQTGREPRPFYTEDGFLFSYIAVSSLHVTMNKLLIKEVTPT